MDDGTVSDAQRILKLTHNVTITIEEIVMQFGDGEIMNDGTVSDALAFGRRRPFIAWVGCPMCAPDL